MVVQQRELRVQQMTWEAEGVVSIRLSRIESDDPLPEWAPGAHIDVYVGDGSTRQYSLCGDPADRSYYEIAVLRDPDGRGGSRYLCDELRVGDRLLVTRPRHHFNLEDAPFHLLIAGGIGVTPIMTFAEHLADQARPYAMVYTGHTAETMPFGRRLARLGDAVHTRVSGVEGRVDLAELVGSLPAGGLVYVCGPLALLRAVEDAAAAAYGPDQDVVRFELFSRAGVEVDAAPAPIDGDSYELVLARSGHTLRLKPDTNILDTAVALGIEIENDCRDGICGSCVTRVLAGTVDHRDLILTRKEQAAMDQMMICCSRPASDRLELDL